MFLFSRFKDFLSKDYWQKAKSHSISSSLGFFLFWMLIVCLVGSALATVNLNRGVNEVIDDFRRDFLDFEISMEDGVLSTRNLPDPFVLSEFLNAEEVPELFGLEEKAIAEFREGFRQGLSDELVVNGQSIEGENLEFVFDTTGDLGINVDTIDPNKLGFYFLAEEVIVTDPTALNEDERIAVESYEGAENFSFDKEAVISVWTENARTILLVFFGLMFGMFVGLYMLLRLITALVWAGLVWMVASLMNFEFDYFEAYGVALVYLVPITFLEILILFGLGWWIPFSTIGFVVLLSVLHGMGMSSVKSKKVEPKAVESK